MIPHLSDTNILLSYNRPQDPQHGLVRGVIDHFQAKGTLVYITPQNLVEY